MIEQLKKLETELHGEGAFIEQYVKLDDIRTIIEQHKQDIKNPLRINLGFGVYGIHYGKIDNVPCLTISTKGTGKVSELTTHENMTELELEKEVASITFSNKESWSVFKHYVDSIPEFVSPQPSPAELIEQHKQDLLHQQAKLDNLKATIESDSFAASFQTLGRYRKALLEVLG